MTNLVLQPAAGGSSMSILIVAIFAIMWFFMIRPQQKKQVIGRGKTKGEKGLRMKEIEKKGGIFWEKG